MSAIKLIDYSDLVRAIRNELKIQSTDTESLNRIKQTINMVYQDEVIPFKRWWWLLGSVDVQTIPFVGNGTADVTPLTAAITLSIAPSSTLGSFVGYYFSVDNYSEVYTIDSHTAGSTAITISKPYTGPLNATASYKIWTDKLALPTNLRESVEIRHDHFRSTMTGLGFQELRRVITASPKAEGRPTYFNVTDYKDPSTGDGEHESDRFRILQIYPSVFSSTVTMHVDYVKEAPWLDDDSDEPVLPLEDRIVLYYGALAQLWSSLMRNPEEAARNFGLYQNKLGRMAGKIEEGFDKPVLQPDSFYFRSKRGNRVRSTRSQHLSNFNGGSSSSNVPTYAKNITIEGGIFTADMTASPGVLIDGRDISVDGAELDALATSAAGYVSGPAVPLSTDGALARWDGITGRLIKDSPGTLLDDSGNLTTNNFTGSSAGVNTGDVTLDVVGSSPNPDGATLVGQVLNLEPANATNPGVVTTGSQTLSGAKTFSATTTVGNLIDSGLTANTVPYADGTKQLVSSTVTPTELGYVSGVTSPIQTQLDSKQPNGNYITDLTGDVTASGPGSAAATLATVNGNVGTFGSSTSIPTVTVNAKGLVTAASGNAVIAPAGTLTGTTLAANVVSSSLTSVGTIASGTWNGTTIDIAHGGTGQTIQTAAFDALSPTTTKGDLIVDDGTDAVRLAVGIDGQVLQADSTQTTGVKWVDGGSGGGAINLISPTNDQNFNQGTVGNWTRYQDAAAATPVDGTGGSPSANETITASTVTPLEGAYSLLLTKSGAANLQGYGFSESSIVVPPYLRGQNLSAGFWFTVASGIYTAGDIQVWMFDQTNSALIVGDIQSLPGTVIGTPMKFVVNFSTLTSTASLRMIVHTASTTTNDFTIEFDKFFVSDVEVIQGSAVSEWKSVTVTGSWNTNTTYTCQSRQIGDSKEYQVLVATSGAPNNVQLNVNLPSGDVIDTTKLINNAVTRGNILPSSSVSLRDDDVNNYEYSGVAYNSTTSVQPVYLDVSGGSLGIPQTITAVTPFAFAANDNVMLHFTLPIVGLTSAVAIANSRIEYASNSGMGAGDDSTSFVNGIDGSPMPSTAYAAEVNKKRIRFQNPIQPTDTIQVQIKDPNNIWVDFKGVGDAPGTFSIDLLHYENNGGYGFGKTEVVSATDMDIIFGHYSANGTSYGGAGSAWGATSGTYRWRVVKYSNAVPVEGSTTKAVATYHYDTFDGYGSGSTKIAKFLNLTYSSDPSNLLTVINDVTLGNTYTANKRLKISIFYVNDSTPQQVGLSKNSANLTTNVGNISNTERLVMIYNPGADDTKEVSISDFAVFGDVYRPHAEGAVIGGGTASRTSIHVIAEEL